MGRNFNKLSFRKVSSLKKVGLHGDGGGLWLKVNKSGSKSWIFRYSRNKKTYDVGIGSLMNISLSEAREKALEYRQLIQAGDDPLRTKKAQELENKRSNNNLITFEQCSTQYITAHQTEWKNAKHAQQWTNTIKTYALPIIGNIPICDIDTPLIMRILTPIWTTKNETAGRVRGRIENILSWAAVHGYRCNENPAQWKGHLENLLAKPSRIKKVQHHKALPYKDMYELMQVLRTNESISARALEFLILNGSRTGEIIGARWVEIDRENNLWIIPAERMKSRQEHRVALSSRAVSILYEMEVIKHSDFIFPSTRIGKGLSNAAMDKLLQKTLGYDCTVHGFRSTFRDWAAECTNYPTDLCEMALAHTIKNKVEAAYRRGDMVDKRRNLSEDWLKFIETPPATGNVIALKQAKKSGI